MYAVGSYWLICPFQDGGIPDDIRAGLLAIKPPIDVDEAGVGTISVDVRIPDVQEQVVEQLARQEAVDVEQCTPTPIEEARERGMCTCVLVPITIG